MLTECADLVCEPDFDGMKYVGDVLYHFSDSNLSFEAGATHWFVKFAQGSQMVRISRSKNCVWRIKEIGHCASLAHELWVVGDSEVRTSTATACAFQDRHHQRLRRPGENGAAQDDNMVRLLLAKSTADFAGDLLDVAKIQFAAAKAWCADTHEGNLGITDRCVRIRGCVQPARLTRLSYQFGHARFNDRAAP